MRSVRWGKQIESRITGGSSPVESGAAPRAARDRIQSLEAPFRRTLIWAMVAITTSSSEERRANAERRRARDARPAYGRLPCTRRQRTRDTPRLRPRDDGPARARLRTPGTARGAGIRERGRAAQRNLLPAGRSRPAPRRGAATR